MSIWEDIYNWVGLYLDSSYRTQFKTNMEKLGKGKSILAKDLAFVQINIYRYLV